MIDPRAIQDVKEKCRRLCAVNEEFARIYKGCDFSFNSTEDLKLLYRHLGDLLFVPTNTIQIVEHFRSELLPILTLYIDFDQPASSCSSLEHLNNCVVLATIVKLHPDALRFVIKYFDTYPSPFDSEGICPEAKKSKKSSAKIKIEYIDVVWSCFEFLKQSPSYFRSKWSWADYIQKFINHEEPMVKWICCNCIRIITGMQEFQFRKLLSRTMTEKELQNCEVDYEFKQTVPVIKDADWKADGFLPDLSESITNVSGIYLPVYKRVEEPKEKMMVEVESTRNNLRRIALAVASNKAVCLQGPVGAGKTSLIEYLAMKTGRVMGESFIKVQLGDQTDSKMLLGTYRCTDVPGEFVWQPGVLTQAVMDGSWLLLEDIDSASMDIASVLTALLENGSLTVPGFKDSIQITPGFHLFVTQRLISTISGDHKKHTNSSALLEKNTLEVNIDPLSPAELEEIIKDLFPPLATIAKRMVDVFLLFIKKSDFTTARNSRLTSTRDLFKWCSRAIIDFDVTSQNSALNVLQDAIDIFCCSLFDATEHLQLAKKISGILGIVDDKAEYFCYFYKPNVSLSPTSLTAGKISLDREATISNSLRPNFCFTRPAACLLERIMCCVKLKEPVLLVGETGTGKTSSVQFLAHTLGHKLIVINLNQQSDSADLLGGYKPVDLKLIIQPIRREFETLFREFYDVNKNLTYLSNIAKCFNESRWDMLVKMMDKSHQAALNRLSEPIKVSVGSKRSQEAAAKKTNKYLQFLARWTKIGVKIQKLALQVKNKNALAFAFVEGSLVKAVQKGYWVLLDEINLANAETLECLSGLLESVKGSLNLLERGDKEPIKRHPDFTLFACMNPSTDVGKKDLPAGLRNRFTEFYVQELNIKQDLLLLVNDYLEALCVKEKVENIVKFYLDIKKQAETALSDGIGHKPHFSLRTLCRALSISSKSPCGTFNRSLLEAFYLSFLTQLDTKSYKIVESLIVRWLLTVKEAKSVLNQPIPKPKEGQFLQFEGYWVSVGTLEPRVPNNYVLTPSVRQNLKDLVRVVSIGRSPVLLQGDTSVGKTSLITYLAKSSGNKCVRINNHEHTDLQEYIGSYIADANGKLVFREGVLIEAMRKGHWIILDELNLAPTDVLEALNRVLDDNRELFIPETQETVKAHKNFMLFATQNPPGLYGGRKMLSRAFRNRFVELHFNEIPSKELEVILHQRCEIPPSYAKKMVQVMIDLQMRRRGSAAFAGKQGFITLRDLFRWGERYRLAKLPSKLYDWDQHLADEGYLLLAGRVRKTDERKEIAQVLQKHTKKIVDPNKLFTLSKETSPVTKNILDILYKNKGKHKEIVWTYNMRQLAVLVAKALEFREPVLLVGETGGGKTTVCKLLADNSNQELFTVNCHMHSESSDFIGGLRPVRDHSDEDINRLFEWVDGPLIQAMHKGGMFLADEISLADDSVLERLNSLLEPERSLLLAEKGFDLYNKENSEVLVADKKFNFIGTMNPGGDFGKKELSPALRNRFTEIWCETCTDRNDLIDIIEQNIGKGIYFGNQEDGRSGIGKSIIEFIEWFKSDEIGKRFTISIRDILTWVEFINQCTGNIEVSDAYIHGACLTFLDSFGSGVTSGENGKNLEKFRLQCMTFLQAQILKQNFEIAPSPQEAKITSTTNKFGIEPFHIEIGSNTPEVPNFTFDAPTTAFNALRVLRGLQLKKAILLEGSPGVGKTSLVSALAKATRHKILRINLSDQTDISDLFGADLPVEGGEGCQFAWRDGPFLQALKNGHWILLDELNLASQSVLEGLNACLDHRGEIFIPELGKTFRVKPGTRLFACQNPLKQGGSRRGLPQSFLNRFTQVFVTPLERSDLICILNDQFPSVPLELLQKMVEFNEKTRLELQTTCKGSPWEMNLRDLARLCEALIYHRGRNSQKEFKVENVVQLIYCDRMRTMNDRRKIEEIFTQVFEKNLSGISPIPYVTENGVFLGDTLLERSVTGVNTNVMKQEKTCLILRFQQSILRNLAYCTSLNWMVLLVGSSGSGKSSIVKTLAHLAGQTLHTLPVTSAMDTTDILGGFEQTDYTRHLEELTKNSEKFLLETVQKCMIDGRNDDAIRLLEQWEGFSAILQQSSRTQTMSAETDQFLEKLRSLQLIWDDLQNFQSTKNEIEKLQQSGRILFENVTREKSLNAGGKFEWVDSLLVKCLKDGSWLLIDNVNLCSPAVLDRLNALLEPNGVLTIGERGVDKNGDMITIKPHENFRLFLTMDPKNGEISRAMRNRGVEIYVLNEKERDYVNELDLKSLIGVAGLNDTNLIKSLLEIHEFISNLLIGEKPNTNHILQCAYLISQQILRGVSIKNSFVNAVFDIYYRSKSPIDFYDTNAASAIKSKTIKILEETSQAEMDLFHEDITLKTKNLNFQIEHIKQQCVPVKQLNEIYSLIHFYTVTTKNDMQLRFKYLNTFLNENSALHVAALEFFKILMREQLFDDRVLDSRWLPDSNLIDNRYGANRTFFSLYLACKQQFLNTLDQNQSGKYVPLYKTLKNDNNTELITDGIEMTMYRIWKEFYTFFTTIWTNNSLHITDNEIIEILSLLKWSYKFYELLITNIRSISPIQYLNLVMKVHVHYKWFWKFSIVKIFSTLKLQLPIKLSKAIDSINKYKMDMLTPSYKLGRNYQKLIHKPPPLINQVQITTKDELISIESNLDAIVHQNLDVKQLLIKAKVQMDYQFDERPEILDSIQSFVRNCKDRNPNKEKLQLLPLRDCFYYFLINSLKIKLYRTHNILLEKLHTAPINLISQFMLFNKSRDERLRHEIFYEIFSYLISNPRNNPGKYGNYPEDVFIPNSSPALTYHLSEFFMSDSKIVITTLGNYRKTEKDYKHAILMLWKNVEQISADDFDFLRCEQKYLESEYKKFLTNFYETLFKIKVSATSDIELTSNECIKKIRETYKNSPLDDKKQEEQLLVTLLQRSYRQLMDLRNSYQYNTKLNAISNLYFLLSYLKSFLNSKLPTMDPLEKMKLKKQYCGEEIQDLFELKNSFEVQNDVYSGNNNSLHPYVGILKKKIDDLRIDNEKFEKYIAVRPNDHEYLVILRHVQHIFNTSLLPSKIIEITDKFCKNLDLIDENSIRELVQLFDNYQQLIETLKPYKIFYPDMIHPILSNIAELVYSIRLKIGLYKKLLIENRYRKYGVRSEDLLNLIRFPQKDHCLKSVQNYTSPQMQTFLSGSFSDDEFVKRENFRLLRSAIQEVFNLCLLDAKYCKKLQKELITEFNRLVKTFMLSWKKQEEELEVKKKEAESLYRLKSKTEEEEEEIDFKTLFPTFFDQDFLDMQNRSLEDDLVVDDTKENQFSGIISDADVKFVAEMHAEFASLCTKTEWLNPNRKNSECDYVTPLIEKFHVFKAILNKSIELFDYKVDQELAGSLSMLAFVAQNFGKTKKPGEQEKNQYNFYVNSNPEEVKNCYHILEEINVRITELLKEWPEHPGFVNIKTIIDRVYNFDISSPLARFLTGLEILLTHVWEQNTQSGIDLNQYVQNLIQQIIAWRKIEINMWKTSLDSAFERTNQSTGKWWLLYDVMNEFFENKTDSDDLIRTLTNFMEQSNLAEFKGRLNLLMTFHCIGVHEQKKKKHSVFINVLWNIHEYFKQFLPNVETRIKELRAPIEKKLKDYIKIIKWKDISYWAVKDTIDKTHKILHKHIREFEHVLREPVTNCLVNTSSQGKSYENIGIWDRPARRTRKSYHYTMEPSSYMAKLSLYKKTQNEEGDTELISKTERYFQKSRLLCKMAILATNYPSSIQHLDEFVTKVIETSQHMQTLEVDTTLNKKKQKSQAKSILQQKRKVLSDLFKYLSEMGLSFRTGLVEAKTEKPFDQFRFRPINLGASFSHFNYSCYADKMLTIWEGCEIYYTRSLMRLRILELSLRNPAKDLGLQNAERCRGFSSHLMVLAKNQKEKLIHTSRLIYYLRSYSSAITAICEEKYVLNIETYGELKEILKNCIIVSEQFKILLETCPESLADNLSEVPILPAIKCDTLGIKDENWQSIFAENNCISATAAKLLTNLEKCFHYVPNTERKLVTSPYVLVNKAELDKDIDLILEKLIWIRSHLNDIPLVDSFIELNKMLLNVQGKIENKYELNKPNDEIRSITEKVMKKILIVIQNMYRKYKNNQQDDASKAEIDFKKLVLTNLFNDIDSLNMESIFKSIGSLLRKIHKEKIDPSILLNVQPLLEQIVLLYQYFLTQQVSAYRVTCKFLSVLLNIFIELASRGFCVPPEFQDDEKEGGSSKEGNGMGLGEGQGEKDVSDRIESEDQLDDAQPAGQEKKDENQPCREEEKGIEMSEDFDGEMQDLEQKEDKDDDESADESDAEEQMGETGEGADQLDQRIWGSDEEDVDGEENSKDEEQGDKGEAEGESELGAKEQPANSDEQEKGSANEKKEEINEMKEQEYDDEQIDPFHGNQPEYPEPEAMDLPDDLQLDEGGEDKQEKDEENPFDIDTMKEQQEPIEEPKTKDDQEKPTEDENQNESDSDQEEHEEAPIDNSQEQKDEIKEEELHIEHKEKVHETEENSEEHEKEAQSESTFDQTDTKEEAEAMDIDNVQAADNVEANPSKKQTPKPSEQTIQEENPDKEGTGQSQMEESTTGHQGQAEAQEDLSRNKDKKEMQENKRKPGESDSQRSLGDTSEPVKKKLKTIDVQYEESKELEEEQGENRADMYQHMKDAKDSDNQVLDTATKEQVEQQKEVPNFEDETAESPTGNEDLLGEEDVEMPETLKEKPEKVGTETRNERGQHPEGEITEEMKDFDIEGDLVETVTVSRGNETSHHIQRNLQKEDPPRLSVKDVNKLRLEVEEQLSIWKDPPTTSEAEQTWEKISSVTSSLAQDLSEQLRLVLEPTQASRLRGDFRTGRRINMRKVIPYIASQFRKDKIWLRRTKPSKREYQIVLAIDDSSSMADNHSKELAFESVALISKALTLLESGQLSVLSFGESTEVLHKLSDQFTERSGSKLLQKFQFAQKKTCISKLVEFATEMLSSSYSSSSSLNAKLLIIVSDGRGIFSEGESVVHQSVRRAILSNIFMVFVIVDNPENRDSVLDIRMPVFSQGKLVEIKSYMDSFPFPFYIILRDINALPNVLSDALRQWFEIVSNLDK